MKFVFFNDLRNGAERVVKETPTRRVVAHKKFMGIAGQWGIFTLDIFNEGNRFVTLQHQGKKEHLVFFSSFLIFLFIIACGDVEVSCCRM